MNDKNLCHRLISMFVKCLLLIEFEILLELVNILSKLLFLTIFLFISLILNTDKLNKQM